MTRQFNTDMERDINRIAIATEKMVKKQQHTIGALEAIMSIIGTALLETVEEKK